MGKNLILSLSLANLLFLSAWQELFRVKMTSPQDLDTRPIQSLFGGTIANVLIIGLILWAAFTIVDRLHNSRLLIAVQCAFLVLIITPLDQLGWDMYSYLEPDWSRTVPLVLWTMLILAPILGCVLLVLYRNASILRVFRGAVFILAPVLPLTMANLGWAMYTAPSNKIKLAAVLPAVAPQRVVWMIFDELDYRIAFEVRPKSIHMPEIDRLRRQSLFALQAHSPAKDTEESIPSLLIGRPIRKTKFVIGRMIAEFPSGKKLSLTGHDTIFARVRKAGFNTALAGWWLPYCQAFGPTLTYCAEPSVSDVKPKTILGNMANQIKEQAAQYWLVTRFGREGAGRTPWCGWGERKDQLMGYKYIRDHTIRMVTNPANSLIFVHWPIPHPLGIYDRHKNDFGLSITDNYLDNLELVDRSIRDVREQLQRAGLWGRTALIVTSDHSLRPSIWEQSPAWTEEEAAISGDKRYPLIPFIVRLPGSAKPVEYKPAFNTILTQGLVLAILKGDVDTPAKAAAWLDEHRRDVPVQYPGPRLAD